MAWLTQLFGAVGGWKVFVISLVLDGVRMAWQAIWGSFLRAKISKLEANELTQATYLARLQETKAAETKIQAASAQAQKIFDAKTTTQDKLGRLVEHFGGKR